MSYDRYLKMSVIVVVLLGGTMMYSVAQGAQAHFYVATNGNDVWSGRLLAPNAAGTDGPFATLGRARDAIREVKAAVGLHQPLKVIVRGGTYYLPETLTLGSQDSGTASFPITYMAYAGEKVVLSGGRLITGPRGPKPATAGEGAWKPYLGKIWQCDLNALGLGELTFKQLFYNGQRQPLARFPNVDPQRPRTGGYLYVYEGGVKDSKTLLKYDPAKLDPSKWAKPTLAEVDVYPYHNWTNDIISIAEIDPAGHAITLAKDATFELTHDTRFYVQNVFEELDAPGEWYLDSETRTLYFWPLADDPARGQAVVPVLDTIVRMDRVGYLRIGGFAIQVCRGTAVHLEATQHCTVAKCTITNAGYDGLVVGGAATDNRVVGNNIAYIGNVGIKFYGQDNLLSNNHLHDTGVINNRYNRAITIAGRDNVASHNLIHDVPAWGLVFAGHDNIVEYNYIHHFGVCTNLSWGMYANDADTSKWPPIIGPKDPPTVGGTIIRYNKVTDGVGYGMPSPGHFEPNPGMGICLDDFVSNTTIYGNVLVRNLRGGIIIHGGKNNIVENNIMGAGIPSTNNHWRTGEELCHNKFFRNIVYYANADPRLLEQYGWTVKGITETSASTAAVPVFLCGWSSVKAAVSESDYNLLFPIRGETVRALLLYRGVSHSFFGPWADEPVENRFAWWRSQGYEPHSIIGDPLFVDAAHDDYRLQPESPAFKMGFKPIPQERIGLYPSPNRASWPVDDRPETWRGEVEMGAAPTVERPSRAQAGRPELKASPDTAGIVVDGDVREWPWNDETRMVVLEQSYTGFLVDAPKSYACAAYDDEALYIAIRNLVEDPKALKTEGEWGRIDVAEIPFQNVSGEEPGPILNLYGFPDGHFETVTEMPLPPEIASKLRQTVTYAAQIGGEDWACEWKIPWAATGIDPANTKKLRFNIGVYKTGVEAWVVWKGTGGPNYRLQNAGDLILVS